MVLLKLVSFRNAHVNRSLNPFSAASDLSYRNSLAVLTWLVNRSVGVGDTGLGFETGEVDEGLGVVGATGKAEYIGFFSGSCIDCKQEC